MATAPPGHLRRRRFDLGFGIGRGGLEADGETPGAVLRAALQGRFDRLGGASTDDCRWHRTWSLAEPRRRESPRAAPSAREWGLPVLLREADSVPRARGLGSPGHFDARPWGFP